MKVIRGAGYVRVSTAEQALRGLSLESQEMDIRAYAEAHGIELVKIYVDKGITARKALNKRQAFQEMMRDVDDGKIDRIIVMRLDRWFRNVYDYHRMMNEHLIPHGVDWCAVKEDYDTTTTNGRLMINLRLAIAEQECDTDGDRIRDVQHNMILKGRWPFGMAPLGYKLENKRLVKDPDTQAHVDFFFRHLLANGSLRGALHATNDAFGTHYEYKRAQTMAHRSIYYGEYDQQREFCPAYITREEHERILYLVSKNIRVRKSPDAGIHLFSSLLICDDCGRRLNAQIIRRPSGTYTTYRCAHAMDNQLCPNNRSLSERVVEKYLLDYIQNDLAQYMVEVEVQGASQRPAQDNTDVIRAKQERVKELFIDGLISLDEYKARIDELERKIIVLPQRSGPNLGRLKQLMEGDFQTIYNGLSREEKRSFWRSILRELHVYRGTIQGPPVFL